MSNNKQDINKILSEQEIIDIKSIQKLLNEQDVVANNNIAFELLGEPKVILKDDDNNLKIISLLCKQRDTSMYHIYLSYTAGETKNAVFLGNFDYKGYRISAAYNGNGLIMLYIESFNRDVQKLVISDVLCIYSVVDDVFISTTKQEGLTDFYLSNKKNHVKELDLVLDGIDYQSFVQCDSNDHYINKVCDVKLDNPDELLYRNDVIKQFELYKKIKYTNTNDIY